MGLRAGLTYDLAMDLPQSLVLDLVAAQAVLEGGAERKMTGADAKASLWQIAALR